MFAGLAVAALSVASPPDSIVRVHRSLPSDRQGVCAGVLILPDVVLTTAECAKMDARYVSTLSYVVDYAIKSHECADHVRISKRVVHECHVASNTKRPYDAKLCNLAPQTDFLVADVGRVPDDPLSTMDFAKSGYNIGLLFLARYPKCWSAQHGPRVARLPWYSDFAPFFNTLTGPITSGVFYGFDQYFLNHPDDSSRGPTGGPFAGNASMLMRLRSAKADLMSQREGYVQQGNGMWLTAKGRETTSFLALSDGSPFFISYQGHQVVLGLHFRAEAVMVSTGAFTRWIFKHVESRLVGRSQNPMEQLFTRYVPRPRAQGQMEAKPLCACVAEEGSLSNGFSVGDRIGCSAHVAHEASFCYVEDAECRGSTVTYSDWMPGAYWMWGDASAGPSEETTIVVSNAEVVAGGIVQGAVCPTGHRYMTIEECQAGEASCAEGEIRSEATLTCVRSIFTDSNVKTCADAIGYCYLPFFATHCANTCLHGEPAYAKCVQSADSEGRTIYRTQRGTRCDPRPVRTHHYDRLGSFAMVPMTSIRIDVFEDGTIAGELQGMSFEGEAGAWLPLSAVRVYLTDETPQRQRPSEPRIDGGVCRCESGATVFAQENAGGFELECPG